MDPTQYLNGLKRRWPIVALALVAAVAVGWFTRDAKVPVIASPQTNYSATVVMLHYDENINQVAALTTLGEVPRRVAKALGSKEDPRALAGAITASGNEDTGLFSITATSADPDRAKLLADTFAKELMSWRLEGRSSSVASQSERLGQIKNEIDQLGSRIAAGGPEADLLDAERDAKVRRYAIMREQLENLTEASNSSGLELIDSGPALPTTQVRNFRALESPLTRVVIAAAIGLMIGLGIALALERFDTRIHTRRQAEEHFGLPVLAEIPKVRWRKRGGLKTTGRRRDSRIDDAFRVLAAAATRSPTSARKQKRPPEFEADGTSRVILVTSAGQDEGKTTVTANLATTFASMGRSVTALSCDFRRPALHNLFRVRNNWGLSDVLRSPNPSDFVNGKWRTQSGVNVVPTGKIPLDPSALLGSSNMVKVLASARGKSEIVLIDSAPILTGDAPHLFGLVDGILIVARAGVTKAEMAERATALLKRLDAPVIGMVFNATQEALVPRYYTPRRSRVRRGFSRVPRHSKQS